MGVAEDFAPSLLVKIGFHPTKLFASGALIGTELVRRPAEAGQIYLCGSRASVRGSGGVMVGGENQRLELRDVGGRQAGGGEFAAASSAFSASLVTALGAWTIS